MNIYALQELVYENELSDLNFKLSKEFGFDSEKHEDFLIEHNFIHSIDVAPIKIDSLIQELVNMKNNGATHAGIEYHCDHEGYMLEGYKINQMSDVDIKMIEEKREKYRQKQNEISELKKKIQLLEDDDKPSYSKDDYPF